MRGERSKGGGEEGLKGDKVFLDQALQDSCFTTQFLIYFIHHFSIQNPFSRNINSTDRARVLCWRGREMERKKTKKKKKPKALN